MRTTIVIPARMASTRLQNKPLVDILGTSLVMRVYKQALACKQADQVIIATDDHQIFDHVKSYGGNVIMTSKEHPSGTDRIAEVAKSIDSEIIINVQGDEPLIKPEQIDDLISLMNKNSAQIATQCKRITDFDLVFDYNTVKVVRDNKDKALYFSRQAIPACRDVKYEFWPSKINYYQHVGIYGFRREILLEIAKLPQTSYEQAESLEQLRWLQSGYPIHCAETHYTSIGVDTEEDLDRVTRYLLENEFHQK